MPLFMELVTRMLKRHPAPGLLILITASSVLGENNVFPGESWLTRDAAAMRIDSASLDALEHLLGGRGCVIRDGYVVKTWGNQSQTADLLSSAKPILSTMLFFAIEEGLVKSVDQPIVDFGWPLEGKDRAITFRHLGSMTSGYARPEPPGEAWAYNDFAIQLYQVTLFDKVYKTNPKAACEDPKRLGALGLQDGLTFSSKRRISASVRDFARIAWFWLNRGKWNDRQVLPRKYFDEYVKPQASRDLPQSRKAKTKDYLKIGTYGGGSAHFTEFGPGIYGFNWWFNGFGPQHSDRRTWPDAPPDTVMSIGAGGNCSAIIPSLNLVLVSASGDWGAIVGGDASAKMNQALKLLAGAAGYKEKTTTSAPIAD
jgi:CubicO group peptidase (beta-lactamase class C family)